MDQKTRTISEATSRFYAQNADTFSQTRQSAWDGWRRLLPSIEQPPNEPSVLDAACGNLRFPRFLASEGITPSCVFAVDACPALLMSTAPEEVPVRRIEADLIELMNEGRTFADLGIPACNLTVCFGFMHHIPERSLRDRLMTLLIEATVPDGICAVSFWQFGRDERLSRKAERMTKLAEQELSVRLDDPQDRFLGWQNSLDSFRFCHDLSDDEVDDLRTCAERAGAECVDDFRADGKSSDLNRYLVLRRIR